MQLGSSTVLALGLALWRDEEGPEGENILYGLDLKFKGKSNLSMNIIYGGLHLWNRPTQTQFLYCRCLGPASIARTHWPSSLDFCSAIGPKPPRDAKSGIGSRSCMNPSLSSRARGVSVHGCGGDGWVSLHTYRQLNKKNYKVIVHSCITGFKVIAT